MQNNALRILYVLVLFKSTFMKIKSFVTGQNLGDIHESPNIYIL